MTFTKLPDKPTYALMRYLEEALRISTVAFTLLDSVKHIVDASPTDRVSNPDVSIMMRMTAELVIQRIVDKFQTYAVDILAEVLSSKPEMIPSGEIDRRIIFQNKSLSEIRVQVLESLLRSYSSKNVVELSRVLNSTMKFSMFKNEEEREYIESIINIRNLLVHNRGMTDYRYRDKFSEGDRSKGGSIALPDNTEVHRRITALAVAIDERAISKFKLETVVRRNA